MRAVWPPASQILPFCSEETLSQLEANLASLPSITQLLLDGKTPDDITAMLLYGIGVSPGAQARGIGYGARGLRGMGF